MYSSTKKKKSEQTIWKLAILIHLFDKEKVKTLDIQRQKTQIYFFFV